MHFSSLSLGLTFLLHLFNEILFLTGRKEAKERHFWQYNVQAKGPKGARVSIEPGVCDPHQYVDVKDPVFSSSALSVQGIKHRWARVNKILLLQLEEKFFFFFLE